MFQVVAALLLDALRGSQALAWWPLLVFFTFPLAILPATVPAAFVGAGSRLVLNRIRRCER
jgi:hypothetical protein